MHRTLYAAIRQGTREHPLIDRFLDALATNARRFPALQQQA
ncbi:hypothetical protein [Nonomuraea sp. NPDC049309]